MEHLQLYETTVLEDSGRLGVHIAVIPTRSSLKINLQALQEVFEPFANWRGLGNVPIVDSLLDVMGTEHEQKSLLEMCGSEGVQSKILQRDAVEFASYIATAPIVPIERSPLGAVSLASLLSSADKVGEVAIGTAVGFAAGGNSVLVLVTVPAGIILVGGAVSFSKWMVENRDRIWKKVLRLRWRQNVEVKRRSDEETERRRERG